MDPFVLSIASTPFEAARNVSTLPAGHRSRKLHGHSFQASVSAGLSDGWASFSGGELPSLSARLEQTLAPLNYAYLNEQLSDPTDQGICRWIRGQLQIDCIDRVAISSTSRQGVSIDRDGVLCTWRRYSLHAAHRLPNVPAGHKCGQMHGHSFEVILHARYGPNIEVTSEVYDRLDELWSPFHFELNYKCLNEIDGLSNPTSELISSWLFNRIHESFPHLAGVTVFETESCGAHYDGSCYQTWKDFSFDSAVKLRRAPPESPHAGIHGHTFKTRLHLTAPLDRIMGWTLDFGDVKELFAPIFKRMDHQPLYEIQELPDTDTESIARWIYETARRDIQHLNRVDLFERPGQGVVVSQKLPEVDQVSSRS